MLAAKTSSIPLTGNVKVNNGSHILYFYQSEELYLENLVSFVQSAQTVSQHVIIIEAPEVYLAMVEKLKLEDQYLDELNHTIHYINNYDFYQMYGDFNFERALTNFKNTVQPFVDDHLSVRVWGKVAWANLSSLESKTIKYESVADLTVSEIGYMTVCTYNANEVPASYQIKLMKSHPYLMTDTDFVKSPFYNNSDQTVFPSLANQKKIKSELDLYRQKLDFIHVIAHEVRNPLTVIKSFATILKSEIEDENIQAKLSLIEDYSTAIDYEINHIIQTEQMLTVDSLWKTKLIKALPTIEEVINVMVVKARTQNINVETNILVPANTIMKGNLMGFRLVISNLLSNAIKYSFEGSTVTFNSFIDQGYIHLHIIDKGVGMTVNEQEKLFRKYEKINQEVAGQGIGLFMVHQLVQHFKGRLTVESEKGKGTKMMVCFPL